MFLLLWLYFVVSCTMCSKCTSSFSLRTFFFQVCLFLSILVLFSRCCCYINTCVSQFKCASLFSLGTYFLCFYSSDSKRCQGVCPGMCVRVHQLHHKRVSFLNRPQWIIYKTTPSKDDSGQIWVTSFILISQYIYIDR